MQVGDRIKTPSGRYGNVITPPGNDYLPLYALCSVDSLPGDRQWLLAEILQVVPANEIAQPAAAGAKPKARKKRKRKNESRD